MSKPLAQRLDDAKLAGTAEVRGGHYYHFRTNEMAANMAINLVAEWLRDRGDIGLAHEVIEGKA